MFNSPDRFTLCRTVTKEDVGTAWMQSKALITNVIVFVYTLHCFVDNTRYIYVCALIYYLQCTFDIIKRKKEKKNTKQTRNSKWFFWIIFIVNTWQNRCCILCAWLWFPPVRWLWRWWWLIVVGFMFTNMRNIM